LQDRRVFTDLNVLIVEDEIMLLELMKEEFEILGAQVSTCTTGREALTEAQNNQYDVLITDIRMPDGTGTWLIEEVIKVVEPAPRIYLCSGYTIEEELIPHDLINKVFKKPIKISEIIKEIEKDLG